MKINRIDVHDRLKDLTEKNQESITSMIESIIKQDPFDGNPFYIFVHKRTMGMDERFQIWLDNPTMPFDNVPSFRILWQPRLSKPMPQENSMLYKVNPKTPDQVKIIWILPEKEQFHLYKKDKFFENDIVFQSVNAFLNDFEKLASSEEDDIDEETAKNIYKSRIRSSTEQKVVHTVQDLFKRK